MLYYNQGNLEGEKIFEEQWWSNRSPKAEIIILGYKPVSDLAHPYYPCWEQYYGIKHIHNDQMTRCDQIECKASLDTQYQFAMEELLRLKQEMAQAGSMLLDSARLNNLNEEKKRKTRGWIHRLNLQPTTPQKHHPHDDWNLSSPDKGDLCWKPTPSSLFD
ncbi:hypothetical protein L218DRAFT_948841 [Marasmius fiardii PR-910]|nr:hypothetical protein L218DRAFT_948841 [Marasmius fiardii PR-910]